LLEGTWTGYEVGSQSGWTFIGSGNKFEIYGPGEWLTGRFSTNTTIVPYQFDLMIDDCYFVYFEGQISLGIFKIEGDILTLRVHAPGDPTRPTSFSSSTSHSSPRMFIFTSF
jgi:hypothetical protein